MQVSPGNKVGVNDSEDEHQDNQNSGQNHGLQLLVGHSLQIQFLGSSRHK